MTNQQHPITPPPELVQQWLDESQDDGNFGIADYITTQSARWGADQQLEMDAKWVTLQTSNQMSAKRLIAEMRPKPPSLAEEALEEINLMEGAMYSADLGCDFTATRRALERLQELEQRND